MRHRILLGQCLEVLVDGDGGAWLHVLAERLHSA
jgi:hypothetical protein